jgi:hypothetical protein
MMGYSTMYSLEIEQGDITIEEFMKTVDEKSNLYYAVDEDGSSVDEIKWYNHEEEMKELSKKFPDIVFRLHGEGEENDDIWYKYFKNGKMQSCYATLHFDDYSEDKLS